MRLRAETAEVLETLSASAQSYIVNAAAPPMESIKKAKKKWDQRPLAAGQTVFVSAIERARALIAYRVQLKEMPENILTLGWYPEPDHTINHLLGLRVSNGSNH